MKRNWTVRFKESDEGVSTLTYLRMCATTAGPYQSPACFPIIRPRRTSLWSPKGAAGLSPNQETRVRWYIAFKCASASSADPGAWPWCTGGDHCSDGPGEPCREASKEAARRFAAEAVHVSASKGWRVRASDQVQSGVRQTFRNRRRKV